MYGLSTGHKGSRNDLALIQIGLRRFGPADADSLVCQSRMEGLPVCRRVDRNRCDPHLLAGADDSHRDLTAVGNQDLRKHQTPPVMAKEKSAETQRRSSTLMVPLQK